MRPAGGSGLPVIGGADTTVFYWTPADEVEVMVFPVGSPSGTVGRTRRFVPANGPGGRLVYPEAGVTALLEPAERCGG